MAPRIIAVAMMTLALAGESFAADAPPAAAPYQDLVASAASTDHTLEREDRVTAAIALRQRDGVEEFRAKIEVRRELAALLARKEAWADAAAQASLAARLAELSGDPKLHLGALLELARYQRRSTDSRIAFDTLRKARQIISALDRPPQEVVEPALLHAELMAEMELNEEREEIYTSLLRIPGVDVLNIEHHRARHTKAHIGGLLDGARWSRVLTLAQEAGAMPIVAEAHDRLGEIAASLKQHTEAAAHFMAAEKAYPPLVRSAPMWATVTGALVAIDDRPAAHAAVERALALIDAAKEPGRAVPLHEARAELRARAGDMAGAYADLRTANELERKQNATRQTFPFVRMTPAVAPAESKAATELATVRSALREAELERTRLRTRQTAGIATVAGLLAALLALGFAYQRRSAAAHASGRHAAELKAERTHWQMLRYQLSPHFLFNALTSLSGLVLTDPPAARRVVDRLSEFCQLALAGARDSLRTVAQESELVRAYLDVEQAGAGDDLRTSVHIAPQAAERMIPPLLLQPLVENALKYGGQTSPDVLQVTVEASVDPATNELILEVANTGQWLEKPATNGRESIGLANVRQRLQQVGASPAALAISSAAGWVRVTIRLPALAGALAATAS